MGADTNVAIVNLALRKLGQKRITDLTDSTDPTAVIVNDVFALKRRALLRAHFWNFAVKTVVLGHVVDSSIVISGATAANPVVITTATAHGLSDDDEVSIVSVVGMTELNGKKYTVAGATANTFQLSGIDGGSYTAYASGGTVGKVTTFITAIGFNNAYNLPSDYIRIQNINGEPADQIDHSLESLGGVKVLLTDEAQMQMKYIYNIEDPTLFDDTFVDVFAFLIAAEVAFSITQSKSMAVEMKKAYEEKLAEARGIDAMEGGTPRRIRQDDIADSRDMDGFRKDSSVRRLVD